MDGYVTVMTRSQLSVAYQQQMIGAAVLMEGDPLLPPDTVN